GLAPRAAARFRDRSARGRRGPARGAGDARPRRPRDDSDLHPREPLAAARDRGAAAPARRREAERAMRRPDPEALLGALPGPLAELARAVLAAADAKGLAVHLVGGPVRDWLLGRAGRRGAARGGAGVGARARDPARALRDRRGGGARRRARPRDGAPRALRARRGAARRRAREPRRGPPAPRLRGERAGPPALGGGPPAG